MHPTAPHRFKVTALSRTRRRRSNRCRRWPCLLLIASCFLLFASFHLLPPIWQLPTDPATSPIVLNNVVGLAIVLIGKNRKQLVFTLALVERLNQRLHDRDRAIVRASITPH